VEAVFDGLHVLKMFRNQFDEVFVIEIPGRGHDNVSGAKRSP